MLEIARAWKPENENGDPWLYRAWLELAAAGRNPQALLELGWLYRSGWGVDQDHGKALTLFRDAAALGYLTAANEVAWHYHEGKGVAVNDRIAVHWLKIACGGRIGVPGPCTISLRPI